MSDTITRHLAITGLVQGVGYRWSMVQEARRLGLSGWVRNRRAGSVEALARGRREAVEALVTWARRGPAGAVVSEVRVEASNEAVEPGFHQISTV